MSELRAEIYRWNGLLERYKVVVTAGALCWEAYAITRGGAERAARKRLRWAHEQTQPFTVLR